jgi:hypothetical protein
MACLKNSQHCEDDYPTSRKPGIVKDGGRQVASIPLMDNSNRVGMTQRENGREYSLGNIVGRASFD